VAPAARWTVLAIAASTSASGCSGTTADGRRPITPSATATSQNGVDLPHQAILDGYKGMWSDYADDLTSHNWQHPTVTAYATGNALLLLEANILFDVHNGLVTKGRPALYPVAKPGPKPSTAEVVDCVDFSGVWKYVEATNALKESAPGGWHLVDATMVLQNDRWKVTELAMGTVGSC
jgi:hypothetical protein